MLHIIPIQTKEEQHALADRFGVTYDERAFAYLAVEEDENGGINSAIGFMEFTVGEDRADVIAVKSAPGIDDPEAMQILSRAAFAFIHRIGVREVFIPEGCADESLMDALRLEKTDKGRRLDLVRFFATKCTER